MIRVDFNAQSVVILKRGVETLTYDLLCSRRKLYVAEHFLELIKGAVVNLSISKISSFVCRYIPF